MKILVSSKAGVELPDAADVQFEVFDEARPIAAEQLDADAVIAWGMRPSVESLRDMPNLRWVQSLSAGTDAFLAAGLPAGALLTSGSGLHDRTVTEHTVALLLSLVRQMPKMYQSQERNLWNRRARGPKPLWDPERVSTLIGARVLIWGFGSIGQHLAGVLTALGADVRGVAQTSGERGGYPVAAPDELPTELANTDVLVMILPATPGTQNALNAEILSYLPARSLVCNVGRGATVDEAALVSALEEGSIAGAALDVFQQEPLPASSALWDAPNCIITPHIAGFRADGGTELVAENLRRLLEGEELQNLVPVE